MRTQVALAVLAVVGVASASDCYTSCMNTYMNQIQSDYANYARYVAQYQDCLDNCSPFSAATVTQCATTYQNCVSRNPSNWQSCYNNYNGCLSTASGWEAEQPTSLATVTQCANTYQTCVSRNPSNW
jgi:hypothetical protein